MQILIISVTNAEIMIFNLARQYDASIASWLTRILGLKDYCWDKLEDIGEVND